VLVGKDGKADAATKLECDYLAQILLPSIKSSGLAGRSEGNLFGTCLYSFVNRVLRAISA